MTEKCLNIELYEIKTKPNGEVVFRAEGRMENTLEQHKFIVTWRLDGQEVATYNPWYVGGQISFAESLDPPGNAQVKTLDGLQNQFGTGDRELCG
jgi:hypothetical protein